MVPNVVVERSNRDEQVSFATSWGGANILTFKRATAFCMGHRFSKHKTTRYARNLGVHGPLAPGYTCLGLR